TKFDANVRSYAPVRARLVREPYRRIRKTSGYAGGYLFVFLRCHIVQFQRTTNKLNGKIIVRKAEA
ncbi:hypothetical protein AB9C82_16795, partial [Salmonella sp. 237J8]|uniref:hypothetical protein n=1 Tax=Salmonella sp. 237J8 TaxID=3233413 RepID=UPI003510B0EA